MPNGEIKTNTAQRRAKKEAETDPPFLITVPIMDITA